MVNSGELAKCRVSGHWVPLLSEGEGWYQCDFCGIWLRRVMTVEESEDEPPESAQSELDRLRRSIKPDDPAD